MPRCHIVCCLFTCGTQTQLWISGQKAQEFIILLSGEIKIFMMDELIDELRQGDICGEFECLLLRKHVTDCVTVGPCDMLVLDAKVRAV